MDIFPKEHLMRKAFICEGIEESTVLKIIERIKHRKIIQKTDDPALDSNVKDTSLLTLLKHQLETPARAWVKKYFKNAIIVDNARKNLPPGEILFWYSKPFLFDNQKKCIFYIEDYCGKRCASRRLSLYELADGKWTLVIHLIKEIL